jgi:Ser/Thr protein kinase RdoA (MazF antagonist)
VADTDPEAWLISPDEDRIAATAAGYASVRALSAAELELLPDAVRFSTAVAGAIHVELALADGVTGPTMDGRLVSLENRLSVADEVAALAAPYLSEESR